ncbi:MAG: cupin domain-containing protein [Oscillospiraceae bacterium]
MNIFDLPPLPLAQELTTILAQNKCVRVERIVSTGQTSHWYDQVESELVVLLQGTATIEFEGGYLTELTGGDTLVIPPHKRHRVAFTSTQPACIWLCVFWKDS